MLSKRARAASAALVVLISCSVPWTHETADEMNLVFAWSNNQIVLDAEVDGRMGRFLVGSAQPRSVLDPDFGGGQDRPARLVLGGRLALPIRPVVENLEGIAAGIIGADAWQNFTLVIDYTRQVVILSRQPVSSMNGPLYRFDGPPTLPILWNGTEQLAILDTALPDTLLVPRQGPEDRGRARIQIAGYDLGLVDFGFADIEQMRVGNRLLSKFLLKIDYRNQAIALWRDPRSVSPAAFQLQGASAQQEAD
jgi:hypothetical protein